MVFLIQRTQNKDSLAIHLKLKEIVVHRRVKQQIDQRRGSNEDEIETLHKHYQKLVEMAKKDIKLTQSHSIEEAEARHEIKQGKQRRWRSTKIQESTRIFL